MVSFCIYYTHMYHTKLLNAKKENELIKFLMLEKFTNNIHYDSVKELQGSV